MVSRLIGTIALGIFLVSGLSSAASAFSEPIGTKMSLIKLGVLYKIASKPLPASQPTGLFPLPADDLTLTGGSVAVSVNNGTLTCTLAAQAYDGTEGWKGYGSPAGSKGWKYRNNLAPDGIAGACKLVLIKKKAIKILTKGTGGLIVNGQGLNSDLALRLGVGSDSYCALATPPHVTEIAGTLLRVKNEPAPPSCPPPLDHYRAYMAVGPDAPEVSLVDQFQEQVVDLGPVIGFMPPVQKHDEPILDPVPHLTCYGIPEGTFDTWVVVDNQFGLQTLSVGDPVALCVPTEKFPEPPGTPLLRDHYKCYQASGSPPSDVLVNLADQFQGQQGVQLLEPYWFCNPVDKNVEGILNPFDHLTCYTTSPPGLPPGIIPVRNQFHEGLLDVWEPLGLCVPSEKLSVVTTTTTTTEPSKTTTTTTETTTSTTTTTIPTLCCQFAPGPDYPGLIPACLDTFLNHAELKCFLLGGMLAPGVCDPYWELCVEAQVPPSDVCCECPVPSPPFPNPQFCFETIMDHVQAKCLPPCVPVAGARCDPLTEMCR